MSARQLLSDTAGWGLLVGLATPYLTAVVQQPGWSSKTKRLVAVGVAVLVGAATCLANGTLDDGKTVLQTIAAVLIASQAVYARLARPSAEAVERNVLAFKHKPVAGRHLARVGPADD